MADLPEGVTTEIAYVARDGSRWRLLDSAVERNNLLARAKDAYETLQAGASVYDAMIAYGIRTPDEIFRRMTKDTPLVISHWQCRDDAGYRVTQFDEKGIFVWGNAGSWSGPYGDYVSLIDLARYARNTLSAGKRE